MSSGNIFSRISSASNNAARLISDAKKSVRNVNEATTVDVSHASASASFGNESGMPNYTSSTSTSGENQSNARSSCQHIDAAVVNTSDSEVHHSPGTSTQYPTAPDATIVEDDTRVFPATTDYFSRFKQIALMAAHASPATGKIIAGHAQTVVKSVAVVAKSAVDSVEATKTAIRTRHEARAKVCLLHLFDPTIIVTLNTVSDAWIKRTNSPRLISSHILPCDYLP
jgi:hypothetical protein